MDGQAPPRPEVVELDPAPEPMRAFHAASKLPHPLLLESVPGGGHGGRFTFLSADPFQIFTERGGEDPFSMIQEALATFRVSPDPELPPFQGGLAGYLGFELHRFLEPAASLPSLGPSLPDLWLGAYDWVVVWDARTGRCRLLSTGLPEGGGAAREARARRRMEWALELLMGEPGGEVSPLAAHSGPREGAEPAAADPSFPVEGFPALRSTFSRSGYLEAVDRVRAYIRAGDVFQVNLSQRLSLPGRQDPWAVYRKLRVDNPGSYAGYVSTGSGTVLSASPEGFLRLRGRQVETRPIKGTAPRSRDSREDRALAEALLDSAKDRAENVMIVDLLRNDLSRVCMDHSVKVTELCALESHPTVHHLVSTVRGELREGTGPVDLLRATFPGGSVTGAPKIRAVEIISELEPVRRGPYTGAVGYLGFDGTMDLNVAIRTVILADGWTHVPVGGGIILDSEPESEYRETLHKAEGLLQALGVAGK